MLKVWVTMLLTCLITVTGCMSSTEQSSSPKGSGKGLSTQQQSIDMHNVDQVIVSRSQAFGQTNDAVYGTFTEPKDISAFEEAFRTAEKILGKLDVRKPDYDIVIVIKGSHRSVHLWLDSKLESGMFTKVSDTGTGYKLTTSASKTLKGMIAGLRYNSEQAVRNGDVVNLLGQWSNLDKWNRFLGNIKTGTADDIHITSYTIEGDPIFQDLIYNGQTIEYTNDTTHDAFGTPMKTVSQCNKIKDKKTDKGTEYSLSGCVDKRDDTFLLLLR